MLLSGWHASHTDKIHVMGPMEDESYCIKPFSEMRRMAFSNTWKSLKNNKSKKTHLAFLSNTGPNTSKKLLFEFALTEGIESSKNGSTLSYARRFVLLLKMSFAIVMQANRLCSESLLSLESVFEDFLSGWCFNTFFLTENETVWFLVLLCAPRHCNLR